jgi:hypothetical protein
MITAQNAELQTEMRQKYKDALHAKKDQFLRDHGITSKVNLVIHDRSGSFSGRAHLGMEESHAKVRSPKNLHYQIDVAGRNPVSSEETLYHELGHLADHEFRRKNYHLSVNQQIRIDKRHDILAEKVANDYGKPYLERMPNNQLKYAKWGRRVAYETYASNYNVTKDGKEKRYHFKERR